MSEADRTVPARILEPWFRALERRDHTISARERAALESVIADTAEIAENLDLICAHDRPTRSTLLIKGWAARYIDLADGRRQIVALHLPGDFIDLHSFPLHRMDHSVLTLTPCVVAYAPHERLHALTDQYPHLTRLLWVSTLIDGAIMRQWLLSAGQRSAIERLANLLCELQHRLEIVDGIKSASLAVPLTQSELGQILGITAIHANRVVQELRSSGLVSWRGANVELLDEAGLRALAEFDPTYLHLEGDRR
jgi:CRP-like cAMP-binding protein